MIDAMQRAQIAGRPVFVHDLIPGDNRDCVVEFYWHNPDMEKHWQAPAESSYGDDAWWREFRAGESQPVCRTCLALTAVAGTSKKRTRPSSPDSDGEDEVDPPQKPPAKKRTKAANTRQGSNKAGASRPPREGSESQAHPSPGRESVDSPPARSRGRRTSQRESVDSPDDVPEAGPSRETTPPSRTPSPPRLSAKAKGKQRADPVPEPAAGKGKGRGKGKGKGKGKTVRLDVSDDEDPEPSSWDPAGGEPMPRNRWVKIDGKNRRTRWQHLAVSSALLLLPWY